MKNTKKKYLTVGSGLIVACGNAKLPITTAIINMGPASRCASAAKGLCQFAPNSETPYAGKCYALKAERMYKETRKSRQKQMDYWQSSPISVIIEDIQLLIAKRAKTKYPLTAIRFNESGDLHYMNDLYRLSAIAKAVKIPVYVYTHRRDLMSGMRRSELDRNLHVLISFWDESLYASGFSVFCLSADMPTDLVVKKCNGACYQGCKLCYSSKKAKAKAIAVELH